MADQYFNVNTWQTIPGGDAGGSLATAFSLPLSSLAKAAARGSVNSDGDRYDFYSFGAPRSGLAFVSLSDLDQGAWINVYNGSAITIGDTLTTTAGSGSSDQRAGFFVKEGEVYRVAVVSASNAATTYNLFVDAPPPAPDSYDDFVAGINIGDAGNDLSSPTTVHLDQVGRALIRGTVGYDNDSGDYYRFTASESGNIAISLTDLTGNAYISLYDAANTVIFQNRVANARDKVIENLPVVAGESYTVVVSPYLSARSQYRLVIDAPPDAEYVPDSINGVALPDAAADRASASHVDLIDGRAAIIGSVGFDIPAEDQAGSGVKVRDLDDWYRIIVSEGNEQLSFRFSGEANGVVVSLKDASGNELHRLTGNYSRTFNAGEVIYLHVKAQPDGSIGSKYDIGISASELVVPDAVNGEPVPGGDAGGSTTTAVAILPDSNNRILIEGSVGLMPGDDSDWYKFTPSESGSAQILVDQGGPTVTLRDAQENPLPLNHQLNAGTSYFLVVRKHPFVAEGTYAVNILLPGAAVDQPPQDTINGRPVDAGNVPQGAAAVDDFSSGDVRISGSVGYGQDAADYYKIMFPASSGTFTLDLSNLDAHFEYSESASGDYLPLPATLYENIPYGANKVYYLKVFSPEAGVEYGFSLQAEVIPPGVDRVDGQVVAGQDAGNSFAEATAIGAFGGSRSLVDISGSVGAYDDVGDCFHFSTTTNGSYRISLEGSTSGLHGFLFDIELNLIDVISPGSQVTYDGVQAGQDYYLVVDPILGAESNYSVQLEYLMPA